MSAAEMHGNSHSSQLCECLHLVSDDEQRIWKRVDTKNVSNASESSSFPAHGQMPACATTDIIMFISRRNASGETATSENTVYSRSNDL